MSRKTHIVPSNTKNNYRQLERLNTHLGNIPITDIKPMDVLEVCRSAEAKRLIEQQLACCIRDMHGKAYNRTVFLPDSKVMIQAWTDYLDKLKVATYQ